MNNNKFHAITLVVILPMLLSQPAHAQSFCSSLKDILLDAKKEFTTYRGSFDFMMDEYKGTRTIGPLSSCSTESVNGVASYSCSLEDLPDNLVNVKSIFTDLDQKINQCLGSSIKAKIRGKAENSVEYDYLPENDDINLSYQRMTPKSSRRLISPSYSVIISIHTVNLFKK